jgi:hypothetical protein
MSRSDLEGKLAGRRVFLVFWRGRVALANSADEALRIVSAIHDERISDEEGHQADRDEAHAQDA